MRAERGSASVELVILTPVLLFLVLLVTYLGRYASAMQVTQHAADHGARSASKTNFSMMHSVGSESAIAYLERSPAGCSDARVNVAVDRDSPRASVLVEVECFVDRSGLNLLGLVPRRVHAVSVEVIDVWRAEE